MYRNRVPLEVIHQRGNGSGPRDSGTRIDFPGGVLYFFSVKVVVDLGHGEFE